MKLLKCENGHFYDADKHSTCPKCSGGDGFSETISLINDTSDTLGGFGATMAANDFSTAGFGGLDATVGVTDIPDSGPISINTANFGVADDVTVPLGHSKSYASHYNTDDDEKTQGVWGGIDISALTGKKESANGGYNSPSGVVIPSGFAAPTFTPAEPSEPFNPSVGWLVCIEGPHLGTDFRLVAGKNKVGRDSSANSVVLSLDTQVSRAPQVEVVYDQLNNLFYAVSGSANSLCYINKQPLLSVVALKKNDVLVVGKSKLMLIPCCDAGFSWNEILKDKEQA